MQERQQAELQLPHADAGGRESQAEGGRSLDSRGCRAHFDPIYTAYT